MFFFETKYLLYIYDDQKKDDYIYEKHLQIR